MKVSFLLEGFYAVVILVAFNSFSPSSGYPQDPTYNVTSGLVGYWNFDESTGTTVKDLSGNGRDGLLNGTVTRVSQGKVNGALSFDGGTAYVSLPNLNTAIGASAYSFSAWVYRNSDSSVFLPILRSSAAQRENFGIDGGNRFPVFVGFYDEVHAKLCNFSSKIIVPKNSWTHITAVFQNSQFQIYVNGMGPEVSALCAYTPTSRVQYIGGAPGITAFSGMLDDVRIYGRALGSDEVQKLYHYGLGTPIDAPLLNTNILQENIYAGPGNFYGMDSSYMPEMLKRTPKFYLAPSGIQALSGSYLVSDPVKINLGLRGIYQQPDEPAFRLTASGPTIPLTFKNIYPGVYFIRLVGRVNQASLPRINKPVMLHLRINDGPNGEISDYKTKVGFQNTLNEVGRIFFQAPKSINTMTAQLYADGASQEELVIHRIEFYDAQAGSTWAASKKVPGTFTYDERTYERQVAADIATHGANELINPDDPSAGIYYNNVIWRMMTDKYFPSPYPKPATPAERIARDDIIWNAMLPFNSMHFGVTSSAPFDYPNAVHPEIHPPFPNGISTMADFVAAYGTWEMYYPSGRYWNHDFDNPWKLVNKKLGLEYTMDDLKQHKPLPDPYPWKDDGLGFYFLSPEAQSIYNSPGTYVFPISKSVLERMSDNYLGALGANSGAGYNLPYRYHLTGDTDVAHDGALALVRMALQWLATQEAQDLDLNSSDPELNWGMTRWSRLGKFYYDAWSSSIAEQLIEGYNRLFDYIQENEEFAATVHRYLPWVQTSQDVVKLLDLYVIQAPISDQKARRVRGVQAPILALSLNPGDLADSYMDITTATIGGYPLGDLPIKLQYENSLTQDGSNFIGSSYYGMFEADGLMNLVTYFQKYKKLAASVGRTFSPLFDVSDVTQFPKLKSYAEFNLDMSVAGGYRPSVGDVSGAPYARRDYSLDANRIVNMWRVSKDHRAAWFLKNLFPTALALLSADEQSQITTQASGMRDPRKSSASRVLGGFGLGILESGTAYDDYRFKRALVMRTGTGGGHAHADALDLNVFAHGLRMAGDFGQRNEGNLCTFPSDGASYTHNVVEVDGYRHPWKALDGWPSGSFSSAYAWTEAFKTGGVSQFMSGAGKSNEHPQVSIFTRDSALIDINDGLVEPKPVTTQTTTPNSYVFDVFRVVGGQLHTFSFHGADTGAEDGGFTVTGLKDNAPLTTSLSPEADNYLRKHADGTKYQGVSSPKLEATWRLGRTSTTANLTNKDGAALSVTTTAAEPNMLSSNYDASAPRKFTKLTLFDHPNETVMAANLYSGYYHINHPVLYVQSGTQGPAYNPNAGLQNVFVSLIEPYVGNPFITQSRTLPIEANESDVLRAVAVELQTTNGLRDVLFSDTRNLRRVVDGGKININGKFAHFSEKDGKFRTLRLVGGAELTKGTISIKPEKASYKALIQSVDYKKNEIQVDQKLPLGVLNGQQLHIYNSDHHSSYKITAVRDSGAGSIISFDNPADVGRLPVLSVTADTVTTENKFAFDDVATRNKGLTALNENGTKVWKLSKKSDLNYALSGSSVALSDFSDIDGDGKASLAVYDFGAGDTVEIPTDIRLTRNDDESCMLEGDVGSIVSLPGTGKMQQSFDKKTWTFLTSIDTQLTRVLAPAAYYIAPRTGAVYLRLENPDWSSPLAPMQLRIR